MSIFSPISKNLDAPYLEIVAGNVYRDLRCLACANKPDGHCAGHRFRDGRDILFVDVQIDRLVARDQRKHIWLISSGVDR